MIVVLDANILWPHVSLLGSRWDELRAAVQENHLRLVVLRHVVQEVRGRDARRLDEHISLLRKGQRYLSAEVRNHVAAAIERATNDHETWSADFESFLVKAGIEVLPTHPHAHDVLASRAARRVKPFDENGMGYRDTLLWLSTVKIAQDAEDNDEVVLVSSDARAFGGAKGLHSALQAELSSAGVDVPVSWVPKLEHVAIPGQFRGEPRPLDELNADVSEEDILRYVEDLLTDESVDFLDLDALQTDADDAYIRVLSTVRSHAVTVQELTSTREVIASFEAEYDAEIALELLDEDGDEPVVHQSSEMMRLKITGSVLLSARASKILDLRDLEIQRVKPVYNLGVRKSLHVTVPPNLNQSLTKALQDIQRHVASMDPEARKRLGLSRLGGSSGQESAEGDIGGESAS